MEGNREAIAAVADRWLEAVQELSDNSVAHGDLQHANVMVRAPRPGRLAWQLKLVDYDGMCVPPLVGRRNLEVGVEPYQHPERGAGTLLSLDLDNFSALVIYVALRALAIQPALWLKYVEQVGYDKLLFRREDFQAPAQSPLYYDLMQLGNNDLRNLTERLFALSQARMEDVPPLGQLANSYAEVERLLAGRQWEAAVDLLNRRGHFRDAPARLQPLIYQAYEHVCRQQAWAKFLRVFNDQRRGGGNERAGRSAVGRGLERIAVRQFSPGRAAAAADRRRPATRAVVGSAAASHPAFGRQDQPVGRKGPGGDRGQLAPGVSA